nr:hypothetical protein [Tanacetum cinerariifolium]
MDLFAFIHSPDLTKVKIVERERVEYEPLLLQTIVGRTVPLLLVVPDRSDSEMETSIDKLFDEGGSDRKAGQGGSTGVGKGPNIQLVTEALGLVTKNVAPLQPRRKRKRKVIVDDAGGSSHSPKNGYSARVYGTLAAHPSPFQKFPAEFMYMPRRKRKRKVIVDDAGGSSHSPKKLRRITEPQVGLL